MAPRGGEYLLDAHALEVSLKRLAIHGIAVPEEIFWRALPREGLDELLLGPLDRRMLGHSGMDDCPSIVRHHDQDAEHLEADWGHSKEGEGNEFRLVMFP